MKSRATELIALLNTEIEQGIENITGLPHSQVKREVSKIKDEAYKVERAPEAEFALLLFRRYADLAENLKSKNELVDRNNNSMLDDVPSYLYEATTEDLPSGYGAFQHNKFWLRAIVCMFCFLTYVVMSTVPNVTSTRLYPADAFLKGCTSGPLSGSFSMAPYQLVIVAAAFEYAHSLLFTIFYILPVDENNQKFIPGMERAIGMCLGNGRRVKDSLHCLSSFCKLYVKIVEMVLDIMFLLAILVICLIASIALERGAMFDLGNGDITFFTIGTFYSTYGHTYPVCVGDDPSSKIRGALATMYMALFVLALATQVSIRSFRYEMRLRLKTIQEASINLNSTRSMREIEEGVQADAERGKRSLVKNRDDDFDDDDDVEEVRL